MHEALEAGESVPVTPVSIADGLNAPFAGPNCVEICRARGVESVLVTEDEIEAGFRFLYGRAKLACEPAGAAGVAALLAGKVPLRSEKAVAVVVSGGNVASETAAAILARR
jgi:threonine dehydratase